MTRTWIEEFRQMGAVAERTRRLLVQRRASRALSLEQRAHLEATLLHLSAVREGFQLSLRRGSGSLNELRDIVLYTLYSIDWRFLEELGLGVQQNDTVEQLGNQLMAYAHATVSMSLAPKMPGSEVSHPNSSHYRDLPAPHGPGGWLERIDELEHVLVRLQYESGRQPSPASLRRTHAYFDASAWLVREHLGRFGL